VQNGAQSLSVKLNDVKFTLNVTNWAFANSANRLQISLRLRDDSGESQGDNDNHVGNSNDDNEKELQYAGMKLVMATKAVIDGQTVDLPAVPSNSKENEDNVVNVVFPSFNSYLLYDPSLRGASGAALLTSSANFVIIFAGLVLCLALN
jgi:hypothetical protein